MRQQIGLGSQMARRIKSNVKLKAAFKFNPFSQRQRQVLNWWTEESPVKDYDGIIADGAIRSGKTVSMSLSFVMWAMQSFNGCNFGMCGKTIGSFRRNVFLTLRQMLLSRGYKVKERRSDSLFIVKMGDVENIFYIFGGRDERSQDLVQGITLAGVFFDEVALMPESFVNQATGRCSIEGSKYWFNCNPGSPNHWFLKNWIEKREAKKLIYLQFTMDDNLSLSEHIKERYKSMYTGVFYKRYIMGLWVLAEGVVYTMFSREKHVRKGRFEYDPYDQDHRRCKYFITIDYGTVNPFAALLAKFDPVTHDVEIIGEVYHAGREGQRADNEEYYKKIVALAGKHPIETIIIDPSAASMIETIKKYRKFLVKAANNDVLNGIQEVTKYLNMDLLHVREECKGLIMEFESYSWDEKSGEDKVIKENDHALDSLRYLIYTAIRSLNKFRV